MSIATAATQVAAQDAAPPCAMLPEFLNVLELSVRLPYPCCVPVMAAGSCRLVVGRQGSAQPSIARWASYGGVAVFCRSFEMPWMDRRLWHGRVAAARLCSHKLAGYDRGSVGRGPRPLGHSLHPASACCELNGRCFTPTASWHDYCSPVADLCCGRLAPDGTCQQCSPCLPMVSLQRCCGPA